VRQYTVGYPATAWLLVITKTFAKHSEAGGHKSKPQNVYACTLLVCISSQQNKIRISN